MVFTTQKRLWRIRICIALLCIAMLVMAVSAAPDRTIPGSVPTVVVNVSPQATPAIQPAADRIIVVTTPVPERVIVVTTVTTVPVVTTATARPTVKPVVVMPEVTTSRVTATTPPGAEVIPAGKQQVMPVNPAELAKERLQETAAGIKDPKTGKELPVDKGAGLPGGGPGTKMPSAEDQWNNRFGSAGTGGGLGGTPFDSNPLGNPMDDFLNQHGGNIPDPLAAYGTGGSGYSPKEGSSGDSGVVKNEDGSFSVLVETTGGDGQTREFVQIDFDADGNYKTDADRQMGEEVFGSQGSSMSVGTTTILVQKVESNPVKTGGSHGQQYEGEGGYTGGGGHSANDLTIGSTGRMTGNVPAGYDPGTAGLGQDTGGRTPKVFEAIAKYVAAGGKVREAKGGFQPGDSGLGGDIGGASESRITGLRNALAAQRFIIDPDATYAEQVPWWMEEKVSPNEMASATQVSAMQAGADQNAAAKNTGAGAVQTK